jgi:hypothetical protein
MRTAEQQIATAIDQVVDALRNGNSQPQQAADAKASPVGMPEIRVSGRELRDLSAEVLAALTAANQPPKLFSRSGSPVRAANFFKIVKTEDGFARTAVSPPLDAAKDLLSRPAQEMNLPALESVSESPFIRPDGTVIDQPGYDSVGRIFLAPSGNLDGFDVPHRPTADDVDAARALIEEVFSDFPFVDGASRANALALFITPEVRSAVRGNVPLALVDAPQAGNGKSLVAEVVALKSTGIAACMKPTPTRDEEEWRKTLTATIRAGVSNRWWHPHLCRYKGVLGQPRRALSAGRSDYGGLGGLPVRPTGANAEGGIQGGRCSCAPSR